MVDISQAIPLKNINSPSLEGIIYQEILNYGWNFMLNINQHARILSGIGLVLAVTTPMSFV